MHNHFHHLEQLFYFFNEAWRFCLFSFGVILLIKTLISRLRKRKQNHSIGTYVEQIERKGDDNED